jgi:hypothetical protein
MDSTTLITLRAVHVLAGAFWVGAALMMVAFIAPTVRALGPDGARFMQRLVGASRFPAAMGIAGMLATLAGVALLWPVSGGLQRAWLASPGGAVLALSGLVGVAAFGVGLAVNKPTAAALSALGDAVERQGAPTPEQAARIDALQRRLARGSLWGTALLVAATLGMAAARYLG